MTGSGFSGFSFSSFGDAEGQITYLSDGESGTVTIDGTYAGKPLKPTVE